MQPIKLAEVITASIAAEKAAEQFYLRLAEMFANHPDVAEYWSEYAHEEAQHARWLEKVCASANSEQLNTPVDMEISAMVRTVANFSFENALAGIKNLEDAYQLATDIENSETNAIFNFVIHNINLDISTTVFLRKQLQEHVSQLNHRLPAKYLSQFSRQATKVVSEN